MERIRQQINHRKQNGVKQFDECDCEKPVTNPLSYVLPDGTYICLIHCEACNGLTRYTVEELPGTEDDEDRNQELTDELKRDVNHLIEENKRLRKKLERQSRRIRMTQNNHPNTDNEIVNPKTKPSNQKPNTETTNDQTTDRHPVESLTLFFQEDFEKEMFLGRQKAIASFAIGCSFLGTLLLSGSTLSAATIALIAIVITIPILLLTNGELSKSESESSKAESS